MTRTFTAAVAVALLAFATAARADLTSFSENFESLSMSDQNALGNTGWQYYYYHLYYDTGFWADTYGPFPVANAAWSFSDIVPAGGGAQGAQALLITVPDGWMAGQQEYWVEPEVFQRQTITAADVGSTWTFQFDAAPADIHSPSAAYAIITLRAPSINYAVMAGNSIETTNLPPGWSTHSVSFTITSQHVGWVLEFGFDAKAGRGSTAGVYYDNLSFTKQVVVPTTRTTWGELKGRYR